MKGYEGRGPKAETGTNTGRHMKGYEGRLMKGDKAAAAPNSRPEWRSWRRANEGRQGGSGSQEQPRMEIMQGDEAAAAAKSSPEWTWGRETYEGRQGGSGSQEQPRIEIMKGNKWREMKRDKATASRPFSDFGNGNPCGEMKGDKVAAAAKSSPEWRSCRETNEGRQGGSGSQEQPRREITQGDKWRKTRRQRQPRAGQNGDHAGRQMRRGGSRKSRPEWRSCRGTNEGRQGGSGGQAQPRMEIRKGDKWRETRWQRHHDHLAIVGISNPIFEK